MEKTNAGEKRTEYSAAQAEHAVKSVTSNDAAAIANSAMPKFARPAPLLDVSQTPGPVRSDEIDTGIEDDTKAGIPAR